KIELAELGSWNWGVIARLKDGQSLNAAQGEVDAVSRAIVDRVRLERPNSSFDLRAELVPLREVFTAKMRLTLLTVFMAVGLLLTIASVNVAHLQLGRLSSRRPEFATRVALGADQSRIVRQLLTENLLMAALGSSAGLVLAWVGAPIVL